MCSYLEDTIDWQTIHYVDEWLDAEVAERYKNQPLAQDWARIAKMSEELYETFEKAGELTAADLQRLSAIAQAIGKAIQVFIGFTGQNPRKGETHTEDEMLDEIADTVLTGILAMQHFKKNDSEVRQILRRRQDRLYRRMVAAKAPSPDSIAVEVNEKKIG